MQETQANSVEESLLGDSGLDLPSKVSCGFSSVYTRSAIVASKALYLSTEVVLFVWRAVSRATQRPRLLQVSLLLGILSL